MTTTEAAPTDRFDSVSVPLDLAATGDRALVVARSLAELGRLPIDLFTVSSVGLDEGEDVWELNRAAELAGVSSPRIAVLHGTDPAVTVTEHLRSRPRALVVMGTSGKGALREWLFGSVTEEVLAGTGRPALVVGPHADAEPVVNPTLIVGLDDDDSTGDALRPALAMWQRTFPTSTAVVTTVVARPDQAADAARRGRDFAGELASCGFQVDVSTVVGDDAARTLEDVADAHPEPIIVTGSRRWWGAASRFHSTTMRLVRNSRHPMLVVPTNATAKYEEPIEALRATGAALA